MNHVSVINTIIVPKGMEAIAEEVRDEYVLYFSKQDGFVSSTFYKSIKREEDGTIKYINTVVWASYEHFEKVVNTGFKNEMGVNQDNMRVLGKGFPEPIQVSPGQFTILRETNA